MEQTKEQKAFMEMLSRCEGSIFKACLMFTDRHPENIKDLYQDIVCALWECWPRFRGECSENTWVHRVAFNTAISHVRHSSKSPLFTSLDDDTCNRLTEESHSDMVNQMYQLIDLLSDKEKTIVYLYLDRVPSREIALTLGLSESTVRHRIVRIKEKLIKLKHKTDE